MPPADPGAAGAGRRGSTKNPAVTIVGIDCAAAAERTGFAVAHFEGGLLTVKECWVGKKGDAAGAQVERLVPVLQEARSTLLALDSPLGWPAALGPHLAVHQAGRPIRAEADALFRRLTDKVVRERIGKNPLEVAADRIARTARAALLVIGALEERLQVRIDLAWSPVIGEGVKAIEAYPAGTLRSYLLARGHGRADGTSTDRAKGLGGSGAGFSDKKGLLRFLARRGALRMNVRSDLADHRLDAVMCAVAARDFLLGESITPSELQMEAARKEGWIWVRDPGCGPARPGVGTASNRA